jgi:hypothetical protein
MDSYFSLDEAYGIHPYLDGLHPQVQAEKRL